MAKDAKVIQISEGLYFDPVSLLLLLLGASSNLYKWVCPSLCPSICMSIRPYDLDLGSPAGRILLPAQACFSASKMIYRFLSGDGLLGEVPSLF